MNEFRFQRMSTSPDGKVKYFAVSDNSDYKLVLTDLMVMDDSDYEKDIDDTKFELKMLQTLLSSLPPHIDKLYMSKILSLYLINFKCFRDHSNWVASMFGEGWLHGNRSPRPLSSESRRMKFLHIVDLNCCMTGDVYKTR